MGIEMYLATNKHNRVDCLIYTALYLDKDGLNLKRTAESHGSLLFHAFLLRKTGPQWFEPDDGLRTVQTLLDHLQNLPPVPNEPELIKWCLDNLRELKQSLLIAQQHGAKFHIAVTPA